MKNYGKQEKMSNYVLYITNMKEKHDQKVIGKIELFLGTRICDGIAVW